MPHPSHVDEETLDRYCFGQVSAEEELADLEEHLLVCSSCQDSLENVMDFLHALRMLQQSSGYGCIANPVPGKTGTDAEQINIL